MSEERLRRSERLRSQERSVSVDAQRSSSIETISSDENCITTTKGGNESRKRTISTAVAIRRSRRLVSLGGSKDCEESINDSKAPSKRPSSRNEKASSVESNASESSTTSTASKRRRHTIGTAIMSSVEVIHEEEETAEAESSVSSIAYHTRSHGPSQEAEEIVVPTARRRNTRRTGQSKEKLPLVKEKETDGTAESTINALGDGVSVDQVPNSTVSSKLESEKCEVNETAVDKGNLSTLKETANGEADMNENRQSPQEVAEVVDALLQKMKEEEVIVGVPLLSEDLLMEKFGIELPSKRSVEEEKEPSEQSLKDKCAKLNDNPETREDRVRKSSDSLEPSTSLSTDTVTIEAMRQESNEANADDRISSPKRESVKLKSPKKKSPKKLDNLMEDSAPDTVKDSSSVVYEVEAQRAVILTDSSTEAKSEENAKVEVESKPLLQLSQTEIDEVETFVESEETKREEEQQYVALQKEKKDKEATSFVAISSPIKSVEVDEKEMEGITEGVDDNDIPIVVENKRKEESNHSVQSKTPLSDAVAMNIEKSLIEKSKRLSKLEREDEMLDSGSMESKMDEMLSKDEVVDASSRDIYSSLSDKAHMKKDEFKEGDLKAASLCTYEKGAKAIVEKKKKSKFMDEKSISSLMVSEDGREAELREHGSEDDEDEINRRWPVIDDVASLWARRKEPQFLINSLSASYSFVVNMGECDVDLPNGLIIDNMETIWQQIAARNKKLLKRFNKFESLFEIPVPTGKVKKEKKKEKNVDEIHFEGEVEPEQDQFEDEEMEGKNEPTDLFNLKEEDLEDLERELNEMENEEAEEREKEDKGNEESIKPTKKRRKTIVDDRFFSLAEMEEYLEREERNDTSKGFFDDVEDDGNDEDKPADYRYSDFFGSEEREPDSTAVKKKSKKKKKLQTAKKFDESEEDGKRKKKKKSVRFAIEEKSDDEQEIGDEGDIRDERVLLGAVEDEQKHESEFEKRQKKIRSKIAAIEEANLRPQSWEMSGEVSCFERDENTLLEQHVAFEHSAKSAPIITVDATARLEALIIQRIKDKAFDDVERKVREPEIEAKYRAPVEEPLVKKSLAEVYEEQFQKTQEGETKEAKVDEKIAEIERLMSELFKKLDALSHFRYIPPEARPEVRIVSNVASLQKEEVGPMASTDDVLMAPEEVKRHEKGEIKSKEERDRTDRARERRKKKKMQRIKNLNKRLHEEGNDGTTSALNGEPKKKKKRKQRLLDESGAATTNENVKSSAFFKQLQQTIVDELKGKTSKSEKKKERLAKRNASAKYIL